MPISTISTGVTLSGSGLALALNTRFRDTYRLSEEGLAPYMADLFEEVPSTMQLETYAYRKTAPYPSQWVRGTTRGTKGFSAVRWSVVNKDWSVGVGWHANDRADDLLRSLDTDAREAGQHFGSLRARINQQIKEAAVDADLLDALPDAPDGVALYSALDGDGNPRFGVTDGNLQGGSGVDNATQGRLDFQAAISRWGMMKNTENQPLVTPAWFAAGFLVEYPPALEQFMRETFKQDLTIQIVTQGGNNVGGAAVANTVSKDKVTLWMNPWLTDDEDWYITLKGAPVKPLIHQNRQPIREIIETMDTPGAEHATRTKEESIWWDSREGWGVALPYGTIKINN